jgi:RNA polymerase sigma factor (sigma-70 family)
MRDDRALFERQVMRHMDAAYNLARWYLKHDADAQDAVQEAMIRAFKSFSGFRGEDAKPWTLQVVRNACLKRLCGRRNEPDQLIDEAEDLCLADARDPEAELLRSADAEAVRGAIQALSPPLREVIVLREFEDMSYAEIAVVLEVPEGTVMSRLSRARGRLAADLRMSVEEER